MCAELAVTGGPAGCAIIKPGIAPPAQAPKSAKKPSPASKLRMSSSLSARDLARAEGFVCRFRADLNDWQTPAVTMTIVIPVTPTLELDERDLDERFIRAAGPGGQNVNKVSTAVELRFRVNGYTVLPDDVRARLRTLAGRRLTLDGEIVIRADEHRTQERNRAEALARLVALVEKATHRPKPRKRTRVPKSEKLKRLESKARRGDTKARRGRVREHD
jgi:ribosome-associated protein